MACCISHKLVKHKTYVYIIGFETYLLWMKVLMGGVNIQIPAIITVSNNCMLNSPYTFLMKPNLTAFEAWATLFLYAKSFSIPSSFSNSFPPLSQSSCKIKGTVDDIFDVDTSKQNNLFINTDGVRSLISLLYRSFSICFNQQVFLHFLLQLITMSQPAEHNRNLTAVDKLLQKCKNILLP